MYDLSDKYINFYQKLCRYNKIKILLCYYSDKYF